MIQRISEASVSKQVSTPPAGCRAAVQTHAGAYCSMFVSPNHFAPLGNNACLCDLFKDGSAEKFIGILNQVLLSDSLYKLLFVYKFPCCSLRSLKPQQNKQLG